MIVEALAAAAVLLLLSFALRLLFCLVWTVLPEQNLTRKYGPGLAVVTGGTSGIGLEIARQLMGQGMRVMIVGLKTESVSDDILQNGSCVKRLDLGDKDGVRELCSAIEAEKPVLLVHCAGLCVPSLLVREKEPSKYVETYVSSLVELTTAFLRGRQSNGGIVFFASQVAFWCSPFAALYAATKSFTAQFATSVAAEYPGIDVLCLYPGAVNDTAFFDKFPNHWYFKVIRLIGQSAKSVASVVFRALGRVTMVDSGILAIASRLFLCFFDENLVNFAAKFATVNLRKQMEAKQELPIL